jgi:adenylate kinase
MAKIAVIIYGPPGSGKGMQADLIVSTMGLVHIETGKIIRAILADNSLKDDLVVARERKMNDAGILNTPSWVFGVLKSRVSAMAKMGYGVVFSGSPRTLYEAGKLMSLLEKLYGKRNIKIFLLKVPLRVAAKRNSNRFICATCKRPLLASYYSEKCARRCPVCAGALERRVDDDPKKFKTRTIEYENRTEPILGFLKRRGYKISAIDGQPAPYKIFARIYAKLKN